ncbi:MAG: aminopeptidase [Bacilli bacterium]|nr:aminopeptidase [Bacilli bacterium]
MKAKVLRKYAELIVKVGANVQKGQDVIVYAELDQPRIVEYVVAEAYKAGAKSVTVRWSHSPIDKIRYKKESIKSLSEVPNWIIEREKHYVKTLPATIYILSEDPDSLKGVNQAKLAKVGQAVYPILKPYRDERENKYQWTIAGVPGAAWAKKVFPDLPKGKAIEKLWEAILYTSRANEGDPVANWQAHNSEIQRRCQYLNSLKIDTLHYTSKNGTDFKVGILHNVNWLGGGERTLGSNIFFNPNIPTEECFTAPERGKAEGVVYSTKPLSYQGELIENFHIVFKGGKAVEVHAEKNEELLKQMISMDEFASYLGEVALVPFDSPIRNSGILFWNTLYDENASCHLALGMGYTNCVKDYGKYTKEELTKMGVNDSMIHVDFMVGSEDLSIVATTQDGKKVQIFKNGNWAF